MIIVAKRVSVFAEALAHARKKVGKYKSHGKSPCNCIRRLVFIGHGGSGAFLGGGDSNKGNSFTSGSFNGYEAVRNIKGDAAAICEFPAIGSLHAFSSLMCDDGAVIFASCNMNLGNSGENLTKKLNEVFGGSDVTTFDKFVSVGPLGHIHLSSKPQGIKSSAPIHKK